MFQFKKVLLLSLAAGVVAWLVHWMSGSSDVVDFLQGLRYTDLRTVSVIDMSGMAPRRVRVRPGHAWRRVYDELQRARPVSVHSVNTRNHTRFYLVELCTDRDGCTQVDVLRTAKNEGILEAHSGAVLLRNDALWPLMDSLLSE